ncbi:hypothetical protein R5R35_013704 [Gryllus longicercus]|uniref:Armadillo repeat-containing protein 7 n=1 Tax=Gryllus longicercus TaxID=2509291 RepID=A0AAN9Z6C7_9ORTH
MFTKNLKNKSNPERKEYLKQLVTEFKETKSFDAKQQVLANLANFAYDPVNYEYLRENAVIDLFLEEISKEESTLMKFALAGLCNLSLDAENKDYILHCNGVKIIFPCLSSQDEDIVLSAITTLMFLVNPASKAEITCEEIASQMVQLSHSPCARIRNLVTIFIEDYCTKEQVPSINTSEYCVESPNAAD